MLQGSIRSIVVSCCLISASGIISGAIAGNKQSYDYSHRMRDCNIVVTCDGQAVADADISVKQIRNHFGFGASIAKWPFDSVGDLYGETFLKYFDYATPENEMKWPSVQYADTILPAPYFGNGDFLVEFCHENNIKVRGHNLFWNEKTDWLPKWAPALSPTEFKTAMGNRVNTAMEHYKGEVVQWDIINEIIHGENGSTPDPVMLEQLSGDPNIFQWVLQKAREIDSESKFVINDYNLIAQYSNRDRFIQKVQPLSNLFDIIGCEGHFGEYVEKSDYEPKINGLAQQLGKPVWLTEVDFSIPENTVPDKLEEMMRTCFANQNVEGLILWIWWAGNRWRDNLTSFLVDSSLQETPTGARWRAVRDEFRTNASGQTDANGGYSFNGFQGQYVVTTTLNGVSDTDTIYLEPGNGAKTCDITYPGCIATLKNRCTSHTAMITVNGRRVLFSHPVDANSNLYLSTFSISGKLLSRTLIDINNKANLSFKVPAGCHIFRVGTAGRTLYTGVGLQL